MYLGLEALEVSCMKAIESLTAELNPLFISNNIQFTEAIMQEQLNYTTKIAMIII